LTRTVQAVADAHVSAAAPGTSYGTATRLQFGGSARARTFLRFDIPEAGAHDLAGQELHHYADSRPNNVDIRYGFPLGGKREALVVTSSPSSIVAAPGFVDAGARDLRLLPGSPPSTRGSPPGSASTSTGSRCRWTVTATELPPRTSERTNAAREDRGGRCAPSAGRGIGRLREQQDGTMV